MRLLDREPISVLSLDVFDTLVWRAVPEPVDAFVLLGRRLRELGHLDAHVPPEVFARLRETAEVRARDRVAPAASTREVSLEDIYDQIPGHLIGGLSADELAAVEVDLEREICFPDLDVLHLARLAQGSGVAHVVLVSDTYFSSKQLRRMLDRNVFEGLDVHRVFTSSDHKRSKASGLYRTVLEDLAVAPEEVLHVGDHSESDVASAAKEGMHTVHFPKLDDELRTVLQHEGVVSRVEAGTRATPIDPVRGDLGLTALRSKATFRSEAGRLPDGVNQYWRFGASVLGPVFTGFGEWIHRRAQEEGVDVVHCLMREGEFLARVVNGARHYLGSPVRGERLWLSRQLCARAAIFEANAEELAGFLSRRRAPTLRQFCEDLGIGLTQLPELFTDAEGRLDQADVFQRTMDAITSRPDVQAAIVTSSSQLRGRLVSYFLETVGRDAGRVVLADIGWGATIQANLQKALAGSGIEVDVTGLYLVTNHLVLDRALDGVKTDGYLAKGGIPEQAVRLIIRSPEIVEQVCMTDVGTLVGFDEENRPVSGPTSQSPVQMLQRTAVQGGVLGFQSEWARYGDVVPPQGRALDDRVRPWLLETLVRFIVSPTTSEAKMFANWSHDENYGSKDAETVIATEVAPLLKYMTPVQFMALPMTRVYWPFGLATLYHPPTAQAVTAILDGVVPPEAFMNDEEHHVVVSVDSLGLMSRVPARLSGRLMTPLSGLLSLVPGFKAIKRSSVRPGGGGRCFVREEMRSQPIRGLMVEFPSGPGVVRIDRLSMVFSVRGQSEPVRVEVEWPEQFRQVTYARCTTLAPNLLFGARRAPQLIYNCPKEWGPSAYKVELEIAFAWLPAAPDTSAKGGQTEALWQLGEQVRGKVMRLWQTAERVAR
ncbi:MAG TPA: HAD hydrolase-like protein [Acidimicrobiales bacterium]|nr:HAD hydrolase-like protein [Acidimicrobiales bacterium]